ncbi:MAG: GTP cyclohydrolase II, partial [Pseudomonas monteilii]
PQMQAQNTESQRTAFTVTIDADPRFGVTTGISASDRAKTIHVAIHPKTVDTDLRRPGHIQPVRSRPGGVLQRVGHTEAAVDLARLAGLYPAGVICEILQADGSAARRPELEAFAAQHGLTFVTIAQLVAYRLRTEQLVHRAGVARLPTELGEFRIVAYANDVDGAQHVALVMGEVEGQGDILGRMHSKSLTGDGFGSQRCDCGPQLEAAMRQIAEAGRGVIVYLDQEGRGIGLVNKIRAYALQDEGADTVEANLALGFGADQRDYAMCLPMLEHLGVKSLRLMTNNPRKVKALTDMSIVVAERVPLHTGHNPHNRYYLATKAGKLGHMLGNEHQGEVPQA